MQVMRVQNTKVQERAGYRIIRPARTGSGAVNIARHTNPAVAWFTSLQRTAVLPGLQDMLLQQKGGF